MLGIIRYLTHSEPVKTFFLLPLEDGHSHPLFSENQKLKWFGPEVERAPTKCPLLIFPFIFSGDSQLPEMCHFKQSSTSYLDETNYYHTSLCTHFPLLSSKNGCNQAWQTTDFYQSAFNIFSASETKGMRRMKAMRKLRQKVLMIPDPQLPPGSLSRFASNKWRFTQCLLPEHGNHYLLYYYYYYIYFFLLWPLSQWQGSFLDIDELCDSTSFQGIEEVNT